MKSFEEPYVAPSSSADRPEDMEKMKEVEVQVAWAEHALRKSNLDPKAKESAIAALLRDRGDWFRREILDDEKSRGIVLNNFPAEKERVFTLLDEHFRETGNLH